LANVKTLLPSEQIQSDDIYILMVSIEQINDCLIKLKIKGYERSDWKKDSYSGNERIRRI
jgi:hypothetical protein